MLKINKKIEGVHYAPSRLFLDVHAIQTCTLVV